MIKEIAQVLLDNDIGLRSNNLILELFFVKRKHYKDNNNFCQKILILEPEEFFDRLEKSVKVKGEFSEDNSMQINSYISNIADKLKNVITCDLKEVPLLINDSYVKDIAIWRLKKGI